MPLPTPPPTSVRVATYNLYLGVDLSLLFGVPVDGMDAVVNELTRQLEITDFPSRARAIARLLVEAQVDLVGLQEVTRWTRGDDVVVDFLEELTAALEEAGAEYDVHAVNENFGGSGANLTITGSNATLVRRDRQDTRQDIRVLAEGTGDYEAGLVVPTPLGEVRIARSWGWVDVELNGRPLRFVNTHTEAYDETVRNAQRDQLLTTLEAVDGPVVLVGDFNAPPDQVGIGAPYKDAWSVADGNPEAGFTCGQSADLRNEESLLRERIDYIWVRGANVRTCQLTGDRPSHRTETGLWPSDHAAVCAELSL